MKPQTIFKELKHHIPFTAVATIAAIIFVFFIRQINYNSSFEILHPIHVLASAIVSSAIFYKYKKNFTQALIIGVISSILIGSLSDIIFPYLGALVFQLKPEFHLPLIEEPLMILGVSIIGGIIGIKTKLTEFPHLVHVSLSVFASLFYIIAFATIANPLQYIIAFAIVFVAVLIPCCISDIILPLIFLKKD